MFMRGCRIAGLMAVVVACSDPPRTRASGDTTQPPSPVVTESTASRSRGYVASAAIPTAADWARADSTTLRLPPDSFPELPAVVRDDLLRRGCTIPQSPDIQERHNVISGQFIRAGQNDWAVLCSIALVSRVLVYRGGTTGVIDTLGASADSDFLQGIGDNRIGFSHRIGVAPKQYIEEMAAEFDGPKPPPIDHDGIEDAFIGKASGVMYFHNGKWIGLQGAD
jgi:hypothetical protein